MVCTSEGSSRTRVKICGITRAEDAMAAARLGADAIGLNFYEPSPRYVNVEVAKAIADATPPFVSVVGLFVNASAERIGAVLRAVRLDLIQFHGDEQAGDCERFARPYIKSIAVKAGCDVGEAIGAYPTASGILLDTWHRRLRGGSGETFDWRLAPERAPVPIILAGGLVADNVGEAIRTVRPFAVDVSGGVEASKGIKDEDKMAAFIQQVNSV